MNIRYFILLLLTVLPIAAAAQNEIETDRPGESENTAIVPYGHFQFEAGLQHQQEDNNFYSFNVPTVLWKYGLVKNVEVRILTEVGTKKSNETLGGLKPIIVGFKLKLWKVNALLPETSLLAQTSIPKFASKDFEQPHPSPRARLLFKNKITSKINLNYNIGAEWDGENAKPTFVYTFSPGLKLSDKVVAFVEEYAFFSPHQRTDHWIDGGIQIVLTKELQLDLSGGYELSSNNHYHSFFETIGFAIRI